MTIEKAFAIAAEPQAIWEALWAELSHGDADRFSVEGSNWPNSLAVRVDLGGIPAEITYRLTWRGDFTEVSATLEPLSARYALMQVLTLGRTRVGFEMLLAQGLLNLKNAVEGTGDEEDEEAVSED